MQAPVAAQAPVVRRNQPQQTGQAGTEAFRHAQMRRTQPMLPAARSAVREAQVSPEKVVLRVRVAELDRARARKRGILGLSFSPRSPLLRSLLNAEPGAQPILLDSLEREDIDSQMGALEEQGVLLVRTLPALVTASGGEARLLTGVTLRPVVTGDDHVRLEVTGAPGGPDSGATHEGNAAPSAGTGCGTVRMRAGQTVAICGPRVSQPEGEDHQQRGALAKSLGLGKKTPQPSQLVLFVTPELLRSGTALETASRLGDETTDEEKSSSWLSNWIAGPKGPAKAVRQASLLERPALEASTQTR
jgi:hypothetical protein